MTPRYAAVRWHGGRCSAFGAAEPEALEHLDAIAGILEATPETVPPATGAAVWIGGNPAIRPPAGTEHWMRRIFRQPPADDRQCWLRRQGIFYAALLPLVAAGDAAVFHGILAEYRGHGILIGGPSGMGKSTAARRLPAPWLVHADDAVLVIRDGGQYFAHPLPTWSRWHSHTGAPRTYRCARSVAVERAFLLSRGANRVDSLNAAESRLGIASTFNNLAPFLARQLPPEESRNLLLAIMEFSTRLAERLPIQLLCATLDGKFWEPLQDALEGAAGQGPCSP